MKFSTKIKSGNCLVFFWASWCGPCHDRSTLRKIKRKYKDLRIIFINAEENLDLADEYSIVIFPTYVFFENAKPVNYAFGVQDFETLDEIIHKTYF